VTESTPSLSSASVADGKRTNGHRASGIPELRYALERGLASELAEVGRLSYARTSVRFRLVGTRDSVTVLFDRRPPKIASADEPAEIEIELTHEQVERFCCGALLMPAVVVSGEVGARGPVRRYLEVDPILRGILARANGGDDTGTSDTPSGQPRVPGQLDPDLLAIETRDLHKSFRAHHVLAGASLSIPEGVISVVLGPSGTGKSVLLQHIIGLLKPDSGEVLIRGRPLGHLSRSEVLSLRTQIGVMFQDGALFSAMNVYDNVAFPLRQHTDMSDREVREIVTTHLEAVGLQDALDKMPSALSGGMKKRAGLARALVLDPSIVLCDEPDSGLDPVRTALLGELLVEQHARIGGTMAVITHNIDLAKKIGEHISVLWQGRIVESGMRDEILGSGSEFVQQFLAGETEGPLSMEA
jgi:phospholipid/cholesterol/gamma-HCH transport system ATP-binding protein